MRPWPRLVGQCGLGRVLPGMPLLRGILVDRDQEGVRVTGKGVRFPMASTTSAHPSHADVSLCYVGLIGRCGVRTKMA